VEGRAVKFFYVFKIVTLAFLLCSCGVKRLSEPERTSPIFDPKFGVFNISVDLTEFYPLTKPNNHLDIQAAATALREGRISYAEYSDLMSGSTPFFRHSHEIYDDLVEPLVISTLSKYQNLKIFDRNLVRFTNKSGAKPIVSQKKQDRIFLVKLKVTELNREIEGEGTDIGGAFNPEDSAGEVILKLPVSLASFWITTLTSLPTSYYSKRVKGVATLDVQIIDEQIGKIIDSFPISGTHTTEVRELGDRFSGFYSRTVGASTEMEAVAAAIEQASEKLIFKLSEYQQRT
jgi:hypothetical protein